MTNHSAECTSYKAGHSVHWIQVRTARAHQAAPIEVTLLQRRGFRVDVIVGGQTQTWRFHDTPVTQRHLDSWDGGEAAEMGSHGLLRLAGGGCLHPCREPQQWQDCPPRAVVER